MLSDRFGRRPVMLLGTGALVFMVVPMFYAMNHAGSIVLAFIAMGTLGVLTSLATVPMLVTITESLPRAVRSGTLATMYACAISVFGGSTQFVVQWLTHVTGSPLAPAWYMTAALLVGGTAAVLSRETAPARVRSNAVAAVPSAAA
jgi:MFS family permease